MILEEIIRSGDLEEFKKYVLKNNCNNCNKCVTCYKNIYNMILQIMPINYDEMIYFIIGNNILPNKFTLIYACYTEKILIIKYLIENNICVPTMECLCEAIYRGNIEMMDYLYNKLESEINKIDEINDMMVYEPKYFYFYGIQMNYNKNFFNWLKYKNYKYTLRDIVDAKNNFPFCNMSLEQEKKLIEFHDNNFNFSDKDNDSDLDYYDL